MLGLLPSSHLSLAFSRVISVGSSGSRSLMRESHVRLTADAVPGSTRETAATTSAPTAAARKQLVLSRPAAGSRNTNIEVSFAIARPPWSGCGSTPYAAAAKASPMARWCRSVHFVDVSPNARWASSAKPTLAIGFGRCSSQSLAAFASAPAAIEATPPGSAVKTLRLATRAGW